MKKNKIIILQLLMVLIVVSLCSCGNKKRKEAEAERIAFTLAVQEYLMQEYGIEAYEIDYIREKDYLGDYERLVMEDQNGISFHVESEATIKPYDFYENYIVAYASAELEKELGIELSSGKSKIYVSLNDKDKNNIDISPQNVSRLKFVATIEGQPNKQILEELYEIYSIIQQNGYENIIFLVEFTDGDAIFDKVVNNYPTYGTDILQYNSDKINAEMLVKETDLTFEEFKECLEIK